MLVKKKIITAISIGKFALIISLDNKNKLKICITNRMLEKKMIGLVLKLL